MEKNTYCTSMGNIISLPFNYSMFYLVLEKLGKINFRKHFLILEECFWRKMSKTHGGVHKNHRDLEVRSDLNKLKEREGEGLKPLDPQNTLSIIYQTDMGYCQCQQTMEDGACTTSTWDVLTLVGWSSSSLSLCRHLIWNRPYNPHGKKGPINEEVISL